jgi:hypothetical protein
MARTYKQDLEEFGAVFPGAGPRERDSELWRAVLDICNENDLLFMIGEARIVTEAPYTTGTLAVTNDSTAVVLTGGAWTTTWSNRKLKIQGRDEVYNVSAIGTATTCTLAEKWLGATDSGLTYQMFRDVYDLPADCEMSKEVLLYDTVLKDRVEFIDYQDFRREKRELGVILGTPCTVTRLGVVSGKAQIEFGPYVPSEARVFQLDYFRSPQKPAAITDPMSPAWPTAFEDVRVKRALANYADKKGHQRRFEFREKYDRRVWEMVRKFDGGNEMKRRIQGTRVTSRGGFRINARWTGA